MISKSVEITIQVKDEASGQIKKVKSELEGISKTSKNCFNLVNLTAGLVAFEKIFNVVKQVTGAISGLVKETSKYADVLAIFSQQTGLSVEAIQEFQAALIRTNTSFESFEISLKYFQRTLSLHDEKLKKYKITSKDLNQALLEVSDKIKNLSSDEERAAMAFELFGRSGQEILPLLKLGSEGINRFRKEARELGIVISEDVVKKVDILGDDLDMLSAQFNAVKLAAAGEMAPQLSEAISQISSLLKKTGEFKETFQLVGNIILGVSKGIVILMRLVEATISIIKAKISKLFEGLLITLKLLISAVTEPIYWVIKGLTGAINLVIKGINLVSKKKINLLDTTGLDSFRTELYQKMNFLIEASREQFIEQGANAYLALEKIFTGGFDKINQNLSETVEKLDKSKDYEQRLQQKEEKLKLDKIKDQLNPEVFFPVIKSAIHDGILTAIGKLKDVGPVIVTQEGIVLNSGKKVRFPGVFGEFRDSRFLGNSIDEFFKRETEKTLHALSLQSDQIKKLLIDVFGERTPDKSIETFYKVLGSLNLYSSGVIQQKVLEGRFDLLSAEIEKEFGIKGGIDAFRKAILKRQIEPEKARDFLYNFNNKLFDNLFQYYNTLLSDPAIDETLKKILKLDKNADVSRIKTEAITTFLTTGELRGLFIPSEKILDLYIKSKNYKEFETKAAELTFEGGELSSQILQTFKAIDEAGKKAESTLERLKSVTKDQLQEILETFTEAFSNLPKAISGEIEWGDFWEGFLKAGFEAIARILDAFAMKYVALATAALTASGGVDWASFGTNMAAAGILEAIAVTVRSLPVELAEGGIVTRPTLALIAEKGESEAVIPLSRLEEIFSKRVRNEDKVQNITIYSPIEDGYFWRKRVKSYIGDEVFRHISIKKFKTIEI